MSPPAPAAWPKRRRLFALLVLLLNVLATVGGAQLSLPAPAAVCGGLEGSAFVRGRRGFLHAQTLIENAQTYEFEMPKQPPRARVLETTSSCSKQCNYETYGGSDRDCFGTFTKTCVVSQLFADGHVLETQIRITCLGTFVNMTGYTDASATVETSCSGEFEQIQVLRVYEPLEGMQSKGGGSQMYVLADSFYSSYTCRQSFFVQRRHELQGFLRPNLLEANIDMSCDAEQSVRIVKGLCVCREAGCVPGADTFKQFPQFGQRMSFPSNPQGVLSRDTWRGPKSQSPQQDDPVSKNFKKLAEHSPRLAWQVASATVGSVLNRGQDILTVPAVIVEYTASQNIYAQNEYEEYPAWSTQPVTSWLHVLCNGYNYPFTADCDGSLSANVRFGQYGSAFVVCNGEWGAYEDVTYICNGKLSEDESEGNDFGTFFSKVSLCTGTYALSPWSTASDNGIKYYGLSEFCKGGYTVRSSNVLEALDDRYLTQVVDPRTVEQLICLVADKNCDQLRSANTPLECAVFIRAAAMPVRQDLMRTSLPDLAAVVVGQGEVDGTDGTWLTHKFTTRYDEL